MRGLLMDDDNQNKKGYSPHEDFWGSLQRFFDLHYRPPKVNESEVNELVKRYKRNHPEEFPSKSPRKGFLHPDKNATA
jgi:hypothetical protein